LGFFTTPTSRHPFSGILAPGLGGLFRLAPDFGGGWGRYGPLFGWCKLVDFFFFLVESCSNPKPRGGGNGSPPFFCSQGHPWGGRLSSTKNYDKTCFAPGLFFNPNRNPPQKNQRDFGGWLGSWGNWGFFWRGGFPCTPTNCASRLSPMPGIFFTTIPFFFCWGGFFFSFFFAPTPNPVFRLFFFLSVCPIRNGPNPRVTLVLFFPTGGFGGGESFPRFSWWANVLGPFGSFITLVLSPDFAMGNSLFFPAPQFFQAFFLPIFQFLCEGFFLGPFPFFCFATLPVFFFSPPKPFQPFGCLLFFGGFSWVEPPHQKPNPTFFFFYVGPPPLLTRGPQRPLFSFHGCPGFFCSNTLFFFSCAPFEKRPWSPFQKRNDFLCSSFPGFWEGFPFFLSSGGPVFLWWLGLGRFFSFLVETRGGFGGVGGSWVCWCWFNGSGFVGGFFWWGWVNPHFFFFFFLFFQKTVTKNGGFCWEKGIPPFGTRLGRGSERGLPRFVGGKGGGFPSILDNEATPRSFLLCWEGLGGERAPFVSVDNQGYPILQGFFPTPFCCFLWG